MARNTPTPSRPVKVDCVRICYNRLRFYAGRSIHSQVPGGACRRAAARRRAPQPRGHAPAPALALLEQDGGIVVPVLRRAGADPERVRRRANEALDALPTVTGDAERGARARPAT